MPAYSVALASSLRLDDEAACVLHRSALKTTLQELQQRLALAQRASGSGIWDWDLVTDECVWSDELFRLFGLDPVTSTASLESWTALIHPGDVAKAEARLIEAISKHRPLVSEYRIVRPSGEERWLSAHGDTVYGDQGQPLRMTGICIDITDRKRLDAQVQARQEHAERQARRAEALLDLPGATEACDEAGLMQYALEATERLTGSVIAFAHMVGDDQQQIELLAWSKATLALHCTAMFDKHYPIRQAGLWADAVRQRVPVVINDYAAAPRKGGLA